MKGKDIPRFSKKHETIVEYLQSKEFAEAKPEYQRRILKQAEFAPQWTLTEARGHGKKTGNVWQVFDEQGKFNSEFKSRKEETKYSEYLNAMKKMLKGEPEAMKAWEKRWRGRTEFILKDGTKVKPVKDIETLRLLEDFRELPLGEDIYTKG